MSYPYAYNYSYSYGLGQGTVVIIALLVAIILAVVLNFTFMSKKNEGKYTGTLGKLYDFLCFNKLYAEKILKLVYIVSAAVVTVMCIITMFFVNFFAGLLTGVIGNVIMRVAYELIMMFIILCRRTVSIDKKLEKIAKFYSDEFDEEEIRAEEINEEESTCAECCDSCTGCGAEPEETTVDEGAGRINTSDR